jgi:hypothetical protein
MKIKVKPDNKIVTVFAWVIAIIIVTTPLTALIGIVYGVQYYRCSLVGDDYKKDYDYSILRGCRLKVNELWVDSEKIRIDDITREKNE